MPILRRASRGFAGCGEESSFSSRHLLEIWELCHRQFRLNQSQIRFSNDRRHRLKRQFDLIIITPVKVSRMKNKQHVLNTIYYAIRQEIPENDGSPRQIARHLLHCLPMLDKQSRRESPCHSFCTIPPKMLILWKCRTDHMRQCMLRPESHPIDNAGAFKREFRRSEIITFKILSRHEEPFHKFPKLSSFVVNHSEPQAGSERECTQHHIHTRPHTFVIVTSDNTRL